MITVVQVGGGSQAHCQKAANRKTESWGKSSEANDLGEKERVAPKSSAEREPSRRAQEENKYVVGQQESRPALSLTDKLGCLFPILALRQEHISLH